MDSDEDDRFSADFEQEMEVLETDINNDTVVEIVISSINARELLLNMDLQFQRMTELLLHT